MRAQVAALAPKIEAMEASWNRLRAISGADTPDSVIEYWQGAHAGAGWRARSHALDGAGRHGVAAACMPCHACMHTHATMCMAHCRACQHGAGP